MSSEDCTNILFKLSGIYNFLKLPERNDASSRNKNVRALQIATSERQQLQAIVEHKI